MRTSHNTFTGLTENILFYPAIFLKQAYALIVRGSGITWAALIALKTYFSAQRNIIVQTPPPLASLPVQAETVHAVADAPRDVTDTEAEQADCPGKWSALEEKCSVLINKNTLNESEKSTFKKYYQEVLSHLFNPEGQDFKHITAFAEKFYIHLDQPELEKALHAVLAQQTARNLQQKWQELADANFHLCVTLSGFATLKTLKDYGIDCTFLLDKLAANPAQAEAFLSRMQTAAPASNWLCNTALIHAIKQGATEIVARLLETDPGCIDVPRKAGQTTLFWAVSRGNADIMRLLLEHGADVNAQNTKKRTALICACDYGKEDIVKLLLEHHADTELKDRDGSTALTQACKREQTAIVKQLLDYDAKVDEQTIHAYAATKYNKDILRLLDLAEQKQSFGRKLAEDNWVAFEQGPIRRLYSKSGLKEYYTEQLIGLFTSEMHAEDLIRSTVTLANEFDKHIPREERQALFTQIIHATPALIENQPEKVRIVEHYL